MPKELIAYQGKEFVLEWYYNKNGKSDVYEYFAKLPPERRRKAATLFKLLADVGSILNTEKFRYEKDQVYVFKPFPDRFFCFFFKNAKIIITNAYEKKSQKMSPREKEKALLRRKDYIERVNQGKYYEK